MFFAKHNYPYGYLLLSIPLHHRSPDDALRTIYNSMTPPDLLACTQKLDTAVSRRYFDFNPEPGALALSPNHRVVFDLLNIDDTFYDVEMGYDQQKRQRYIRVRLKVALSIIFRRNKGEQRVNLNKDDTLLLWRYWHNDSPGVIGQLERNGFGVLQVNQTEEHDYSLVVCDIKPGSDQPG